MKKKIRIIFIITLFIIILLIILFAKQRAEEVIVPTPPTELKNITPVTTPDFNIQYSYKTGGFIIKSDLGLSATEKALEIWLNEKGFGDIKSERFEYQSNKLSL